jgi:AraC family transcriptional regulator
MGGKKEPETALGAEHVARLAELLRPVNSSTGYPWEGLAIDVFKVDEPASVRVSFDDYYLAVACRGTGSVWVPGERGQHPFAEGDVAILPPGVEHGVRTQGPSAGVSIYLSRSLLTLAAADTLNPASIEFAPRFAVSDPTLKQLALALACEVQSGLPPNRLLGESLGSALAAHVLVRYAGKPMVKLSYRGGMSKYLLRRTIDYMHSNLGADLRLSELAGIAQMSTWHFCRMFKQSTGLSPHQYLMRERIEAAKRLLMRRGADVEKIAVELGFTDRSHFYNSFSAAGRRTAGPLPARSLKSQITKVCEKIESIYAISCNIVKFLHNRAIELALNLCDEAMRLCGCLIEDAVA